MRAQTHGAAASQLRRQQEKHRHLPKFIDRFKARPARPSRRRTASRRWRVWKNGAGADREATSPSSSASRRPAESDARAGWPGPRLHRRRYAAKPSCAASTVRCWPAAHRHPRRQRGGQVHAREDHGAARAAASAHHRGQGPGHRLRFAQEELDCCADRPRWSTWCALADGAWAPEQELRDFPRRHPASSGDVVHAGRRQHYRAAKARLVPAMRGLAAPQPAAATRPTNHLDLPPPARRWPWRSTSSTVTVMLVSHDRALLRLVCEDFGRRAWSKPLGRRPRRLPALAAQAQYQRLTKAAADSSRKLRERQRQGGKRREDPHAAAARQAHCRDEIKPPKKELAHRPSPGRAVRRARQARGELLPTPRSRPSRSPDRQAAEDGQRGHRAPRRPLARASTRIDELGADR